MIKVKIKEKEDDDVLYLEETYLEDPEEGNRNEDKEDINNNDQSEEMVFDNTKLNSHSHDLENEKGVRLQHNTQISSDRVVNSSLQVKNNDHLVLKENMIKIKELLEKMQNKLQRKQQKRQISSLSN
ncbi:hypothetical protein [Wolbachia endosymbiont of Atemnus politus]|uniref:hypothetical protein n=1 Tax=Wolbachia endosymbiont of Atemnus politus TaxID=2682840 RepID=UPI00397C2326